MKKTFAAVLCILALSLSGCAGGSPAVGSSSAGGNPPLSDDSMSLDAAIGEAAAYFGARLPPGARLALLPFDTPSGRLSDYVFEELWGRFEDSGRFVMVDRRNLDRIDSEIRHQLSGKVDDSLAVSITKQYGAEILVHGQIVPSGGGYRAAIYATDVEKAASSQRAFTLEPDTRLLSLLNTSPDEEVARAVSAMARSVEGTITIAVGRIAYTDTGAVSSLSAWLKNAVLAEAEQRREKFRVASEGESADFAVLSRGLTVETSPGQSGIQALISGNYSPLDSGAEVTLRLVSAAGNRVVLSSSRFFIPAGELARRELSLLPVSQAEFDSRQKAVAPYAGGNNRWGFTVTPDVLDGIYYDGTYMTMRIYSERDCYFRVIHVDVNGNTQVIYPLAASDNNFIRAGETRRIPDTTRFRLGAPFGEELILAAAYERPFSADSAGRGAVPLSADGISRGLTVEDNNHSAISPAATAKFSYTILAR